MNKKVIVLLLLVLLPLVTLFAQSDVTKFGVIDTSRVYTTHFRNSSGVRNYESKRTEFQNEINKLTEELKTLQIQKTNYTKDGNDTAALRLEADIIKKTDFLTEYTRTKNIELESLKNNLDSSDSFYSSLYSVIERIAEQEGYSMILSLQQANSILWYSPSVDRTDKVIAALSSL